MSLTYSAPALNITLQIIEDSGVDPLSIMKQLGLDPHKRNDPNARYSYAKVDRLWCMAAEQIGDDSFGLKAAKFWHPSQLGALGYGWLTSSTLRTALNRFVRYMRILTEGACLSMSDAADVLEVTLAYNEMSRKQATRTDSFMAMLVAMCRANMGQGFSPKYVCLVHPEPKNLPPFYALFRCPVYFSSSSNCFGISVDDADKVLESSNPQLAQLNDQVMLQYVAALDKSDVISQVKKIISEQLASGELSDEMVANELHMSVRTMQRKLGDQDSSFKALLNEVRMDLADKYIRDSRMSISEISYSLGFAESSSFSRYFKREAGLSPSELRSSINAA